MSNDHDEDFTIRSLSESWTSLSTSDLHSEDDGTSTRTDTASIIGHTEPDDLSSLNDEEYQFGDADERASVDRDETIEEHRTQLSESFPTPNDSGLTMKPSYHSSASSIEFEEPERWPAAEEIELSHTIRLMDPELNAYDFDKPPSNTSSQNVITVRQTMAKDGLDLTKPFRVLYVGQIDFRHLILDKIGDVLVANTDLGQGIEPRRYHVIPTSFGSGPSPSYAELLPIQVQLVVDMCQAAELTRGTAGEGVIKLDLTNRSSCYSRLVDGRYQIESSPTLTLPDIAIIMQSSLDSLPARNSAHLVYEFTKRHGVPIMLISDKQYWHGEVAEQMPLDHKSLHLCLEHRHALPGETRVLKRIPIDLETLESVSPAQINRNLACLTARSRNSQGGQASDSSANQMFSMSSEKVDGSPGNHMRVSQTFVYPLSVVRRDISTWLCLVAFIVACSVLHVFVTKAPTQAQQLGDSEKTQRIFPDNQVIEQMTLGNAQDCQMTSVWTYSEGRMGRQFVCHDKDMPSLRTVWVAEAGEHESLSKSGDDKNSLPDALPVSKRDTFKLDEYLAHQRKGFGGSPLEGGSNFEALRLDEAHIKITCTSEPPQPTASVIEVQVESNGVSEEYGPLEVGEGSLILHVRQLAHQLETGDLVNVSIIDATRPIHRQHFTFHRKAVRSNENVSLTEFLYSKITEILSGSRQKLARVVNSLQRDRRMSDAGMSKLNYRSRFELPGTEGMQRQLLNKTRALASRSVAARYHIYKKLAVLSLRLNKQAAQVGTVVTQSSQTIQDAIGQAMASSYAADTVKSSTHILIDSSRELRPLRSSFLASAQARTKHMLKGGRSSNRSREVLAENTHTAQ